MRKAGSDLTPRGFHSPAVRILALLCVLAFAASAEAGDPVAVVTFKDVPLDAVTRTELSNLFLAELDVVGGVKVKIANIADPAVKFPFLESLTGLGEKDLEDHFVAMNLRGEGDWPSEFGDAGELVKMVIRYKQAIVWMPMADWNRIPEKHRSVLKVLSVDGRRPGDPGYDLQS